jgi:hypothetical protein
MESKKTDMFQEERESGREVKKIGDIKKSNLNNKRSSNNLPLHGSLMEHTTENPSLFYI